MGRKTVLSVALGILLLPIIFLGVASAQSVRSGDSVLVAKSESVDATLFSTAKNIDIAGTVNGDVICAGQNITISGTVNGDVICAGQNIRISGVVNGNARLAGQSLTVSGQITDRATFASQTTTLEATSQVSSDVMIVSGDVFSNGNIGRDLGLAGGNATINGTIGRDLKGPIENLTLGDSAVLQGSVEYTSNKDLVKQPGAQVTGQVTRSQPKNNESYYGPSALVVGVSFAIYLFVSLLLVSLALALFFPKSLDDASRGAWSEPLKTILIGIAAHITVPILLTIFAFTIIGIPLALITGLVWLVILSLSGPYFAYIVGTKILKNSRQPLVIMLVGSIIVLALYFVPFVGLLVMLSAGIVGTGALVNDATQRLPRPVHTLSKTTKK